MLTLDRSQLNDNNNDFEFHDPATDGDDCNVAMCSQAIELVLGTKVSAAQVRSLGRVPSGPTGNAMVVEVFRRVGLVPVTQYQMLWRGNPVQNVRNLLDAGWFVVGYVNYGTLADSGGTIGDRGYRGIHAIGIQDWWRKKGGGRMVHEADPLFDGRHPHTPKGVQAVSFPPIRDAAAAYAGVGRFSGYAVKPAK